MNKKNLPKRSLTRLIAVQSLYQFDFYNRKVSLDNLAKQLAEDYFLTENKRLNLSEKQIDKDFLESLLSGIALVIDKVDEEISGFLKGEWKIDNLPDIILQILRLGAFEIKFMKDTPEKVIISEYVDLAACFYDKKQITFVNSILQNISNKNR